MIEEILNGIRFYKITGYCPASLFELINKVEELSNGEQAKVICDETIFVSIFNDNNILNGYLFKKIGNHFVYANNKTVSRYKGYLNINGNDSVILIISNEYNPIGIIIL